jgi:hypothetical protein
MMITSYLHTHVSIVACFWIAILTSSQGLLQRELPNWRRLTTAHSSTQQGQQEIGCEEAFMNLVNDDHIVPARVCIPIVAVAEVSANAKCGRGLIHNGRW